MTNTIGARTRSGPLVHDRASRLLQLEIVVVVVEVKGFVVVVDFVSLTSCFIPDSLDIRLDITSLVVDLLVFKVRIGSCLPRRSDNLQANVLLTSEIEPQPWQPIVLSSVAAEYADLSLGHYVSRR